MAFLSNSSAFGIKPAGQTGTSIFGQTNTTNPLFGSAPQASTSTGAFGTQQQAQGTTQGTSLFGSTLGQNTQQQQPQQNQGSSLLGGGFGQQQPAQQNTGNNIFGQPAANSQQSTNTFGTSLFGNTQNQQNNQQGTQSGFGQLGTNTNNTSTFGGLGAFGGNNASQQAQPTQSTNAFGLGSSTLPGGSLFGRQPSQQPLSAPQPNGPPPFTKSTKFNDLPDEIKKVFETVDSHIQARIHISEELKQRKLGEEPTKGQDLIRTVHKDLVDTLATMRSDVHQTRDLKSKVDQTVQDTIVATRIIDGFRNPQQHGVYLKNHATFPIEFYTRITEQMQERLSWYKVTIEQIERKLSSAAGQTQYTPQSIVSTLEAQHATFISLASKTAALDAELQKLRVLYTQLWRAKTGSMRDPFNELDRGSGGDFGLESLNAN